MNWLDIVLAIVLGLSIAAGFAKGFARVGIGLAAVVVGLLLGVWFYGVAGALLHPYLSSRALANFVGFLLILVAVQVAGAALAWLLAKLMKWAGLGWLDRVLGALIGAVRGLVLSIAIVLALVAFAPKPPPQSVVGSAIAPYVIDAAHVIAAIAPKEMREGFREGHERIRKIWKEAMEKRGAKAPREEL